MLNRTYLHDQAPQRDRRVWPHQEELERQWSSLVRFVKENQVQLLLLPEFPFTKWFFAEKNGVYSCNYIALILLITSD